MKYIVYVLGYITILNHIHMSLPVCGCVYAYMRNMCADTHGGQSCLELHFQTVVNYLMWVLGPGLRVFGITVALLNAKPSLQLLMDIFKGGSSMSAYSMIVYLALFLYYMFFLLWNKL